MTKRRIVVVLVACASMVVLGARVRSQTRGADRRTRSSVARQRKRAEMVRRLRQLKVEQERRIFALCGWCISRENGIHYTA
jgi:hypothetical protein